jgi:hypothetical protein
MLITSVILYEFNNNISGKAHFLSPFSILIYVKLLLLTIHQLSNSFKRQEERRVIFVTSGQQCRGVFAPALLYQLNSATA